MYYVRKYIQFNDLVFDGYDMLSDADASNVSFTVNTHDYTFRNGSYSPLKKRVPRIESSSVSMTIYLEMKRIACDLRDFYRKFAVEELTKAGKLWAVQNNELVWAYAIPSSFSEQNNLVKYRLEIDVEFELPEGVWHKADKQKTFLVDEDVCEFLRCKEYKKINPCDGCCSSCPKVDSKLCCCCNNVCEENALCYNEDKLADVYKKCSHGFKVVYDCSSAESIFTDEAHPYLGQSLCRNAFCDKTISGRLYSETDVPTDNFRIIMNGGAVDPSISINDNVNTIKGEYEGELIIESNGDVYHNGELLPVDAWTVPQGNTYGWEIEPGYNRVIIELGDCCHIRCVYFQMDNLTI